MVPMYADMLEQDRRQHGFTAADVAWCFSVGVREFWEFQTRTGFLTIDTWNAIRSLNASTQSFVDQTSPPRR
jgi:hypothetical protein